MPSEDKLPNRSLPTMPCVCHVARADENHALRERAFEPGR